MKLLLYATIFKEGGKQMKDSELQIDRSCHVLVGTFFVSVGFYP